jgi:hypothetical protein
LEYIPGFTQSASPTPQALNSNQFNKSDKIMTEPIAVVGLSFGFPGGATSSEAFWEILMQKKNATTAFPTSRLNAGAMYHANPNRRGQVRSESRDKP